MCGKGKGACRCVCLYTWSETITIKDKIQVSKLLVMQVETQYYNSLFDSCFSPSPNSCRVLPDCTLSGRPVSAHSLHCCKRERERPVSDASTQKVSEWEKWERLSWGQLIFQNSEEKCSVIRVLRSVGEDSFKPLEKKNRFLFNNCSLKHEPEYLR